MKVAIFLTYPFRPHKFHYKFLKNELSNSGIKYIEYKGLNKKSLNYYKLINSKSFFSKLKYWIWRLGYIPRFTSTSDFKRNLKDKNFDSAINSVIATSNRFETKSQLNNFIENNKDFIKDYKNDLKESFIDFENFLKKNNINFVIGFNGRMDHTRVYFDVCKILNIPFFSYESSWFGNGLQLISNNDCLSLDVWHKSNKRFLKYKLSKNQSRLAAVYASSRFNKIMKSEWRDYSNNQHLPKEFKNKIKVLILPSSRSEFEGHPDYISSWRHSTNGFLKIIDFLGVKKKDVYLQMHPIWFQKIYSIDGKNIIDFYREWANSYNISVISENFAFESKDLIAKSEIILINGSSACFEAGILGKKIINTENNKFNYSGICLDVLSEKNIGDIKPWIKNFKSEKVQRRTFRFFYNIMFRINSYESNVRSNLSPTSYNYNYSKNKIQKIIERAISRDDIFSDEYIYEGDMDYEKFYIDSILEGKTFEEFRDFKQGINYENIFTKIRNIFPKGDL